MSEFKPWPKIKRLNRDIIISEKIDGTNAAIGIVPETYETAGPGGGSETVSTGRMLVYAQSRTRLIKPGKTDNVGFAGWVEKHKDLLAQHLGEGLHFGEWWGCGIQRGYDLSERRFSLFQTTRWNRPEGALALEALRAAGVAVSTVPVLYIGPWTGVLGYKVNDEARADHGQWMNLAEQLDWSDVDFAREIEAQVELLYERIQVLTQMDLRDAVNIRMAPVNPRPRFAPSFILEHLKRTGSVAAPGYMKPEGIVIYHPASDYTAKVTVEGDDTHKGERSDGTPVR